MFSTQHSACKSTGSESDKDVCTERIADEDNYLQQTMFSTQHSTCKSIVSESDEEPFEDVYTESIADEDGSLQQKMFSKQHSACKSTVFENDECSDDEYLAAFGKLFHKKKYHREKLKFHLFIHGRCIAVEAIGAALRLNSESKQYYDIWSYGMGISPPAVTALLNSLGMDSRNKQLRTEIHRLSGTYRFLAHAHTHFPDVNLPKVPPPKDEVEALTRSDFDSMCKLASQIETVSEMLQIIEGRNCRILNSRLEFRKKQEETVENQENTNNTNSDNLQPKEVIINGDKTQCLSPKPQVGILHEDLTSFGECCPMKKYCREELKFHLFLHGHCIVEEAMRTALRLHRESKKYYPVWSYAIGISVHAVTELLDSLGMDSANVQLRTEIHHLSSTHRFLAHAHKHFPDSNLPKVPPPKDEAEALTRSEFDRMCTLASQLQSIGHVLRIIEKRNDRILNSQLEFRKKEKETLENQENTNNTNSKSLQCVEVNIYRDKTQCLSPKPQVDILHGKSQHSDSNVGTSSKHKIL